MSFASRLSHNVLRLAKLGKHRLGGCGIGAPLLQPSQRFKHGFFIGRTLFAFGLIGLLESLHVALHRRSMLHTPAVPLQSQACQDPDQPRRHRSP
jgi:hypothetical protein